MRKTLLLLAVLLVASVLAALRLTDRPPQRTLTVFAAASLTDAFEEIGEAFEAAHPGTRVLFHFAGSSTLAAQLAQGAPADVFASADQAQMGAVIAAGRVTRGAPAVFARGRLVLIAPRGAGVTSLADLAEPGVRLVLAAPGVPARVYAEILLANLTADPAYGPGYPAAVLANLVSEEPNVRQVAAKVALGEADAGLVYATDVTPDIADAVTVTSLPEAFNPTADYPIAALADAAEPELAAAFVQFVRGEAGQRILQRRGFLLAHPEAAP